MAHDLSIFPGVPKAGAGPVLAAPRSRLIDLRWSELGVALALLAGVGASFGALIAVITAVDRSAFYLRNALEPQLRSALWLTILAGALTLPAIAFTLVLGTRGRAVPAVVRLADRIGPLILVGLLPSLFAYRVWWSNQLVFLLQLTMVVLLAERLVTRCLASMPELFRSAARSQNRPWLQRHLPLVIVIVAGLAYAAAFSFFTLLHHRRFGTTAFDLGINVNWCYNALHGRPFRSTVLFGPDGGNFLAGHAIFAMFMWLPLYAISPGPEVFLIYQSVMLGLAAIPLYLTAKELVPRSAAVAVALCYLMFAPLHGPNFYDFHEVPVALPFHFLLHYCIVTRRNRWVPLLLLVLYAHREDVSVGLAILGIFLIVTGARPKLGAVLAVVSPIVFVLIKFVLMPWAGSWWFADMYKDLQPAGSQGYGPVVQTILINPVYGLSTLLKEDKLVYFLHLFAPLVFLPLRRLALLLLAIPGFFFTLMTTGYPPTISIAFQYTTHWIPYLFLASMISLKLLRDVHGPARQWGAVIAMVLGVAAHSTTFGAVIQQENFIGGFFKVGFEESEKDKKLYADFKKLIRQIPRDASIAATEREVPHVAARLDVYTLRSGHGDADYLLIRSGEAGPIGQDAFKRNQYGLVGQVERTFYLFKKNHVGKATEKAKAELGIR